MNTKGELVKKIVKELEKPTKYKKIQKKFEDRTELEISLARIKQVVKNMVEDNEATIERKVNEKGNAVVYVSTVEEHESE